MGRAPRRPAPEENIESNGEIHQPDEPHALKETAIGRLENHRCIDGNAGTNQAVIDPPVDANVKPSADQGGHARRGRVAGGNQQIASLDTGPLPRTILEHALCFQSSRGFHPPHTIRGFLVGAFLGKIQGCQNCGSKGKQSKSKDRYSNL